MKEVKRELIDCIIFICELEEYLFKKAIEIIIPLSHILNNINSAMTAGIESSALIHAAREAIKLTMGGIEKRKRAIQ